MEVTTLEMQIMLFLPMGMAVGFLIWYMEARREVRNLREKVCELEERLEQQNKDSSPSQL